VAGRWGAGVGLHGAGRGPLSTQPAPVGPVACQLERGPAAHGWTDQRWTLARVSLLIGRLFHVSYTLRGTSYLLHRIGFSPQVPARRALERDAGKVADWRSQTWAKVRG
jgi:transposase